MRACQAAIDAAQHVVAKNRLGVPQNSAEAFIHLEKANILSSTTVRNMIAMTGFRNIAVHEYQSLDIRVLHAIAADEYRSVVEFCRELGMRIEIPY